MYIPNDVAPGQPISSKEFNALLRALRASQISAGPGLRVQRSSVGVTVALAREAGASRGGPVSLVHPFQVTDASTETAAIVQVKAGSVNDITPTGVGANIALTSAGTWRIYLDCTLNTDAAGAVTAAVVTKTSGEQPANTRTKAYITLATVAVVAVTGGLKVDVIDQFATHSLRFFPCSRSDEVDGAYQFWGF